MIHKNLYSVLRYAVVYETEKHWPVETMSTISHRKKDVNWLRIESGTSIELVLAKNKEGHELRTKNDSGTSDIATTTIWNTRTGHLLIWYYHTLRRLYIFI